MAPIPRIAAKPLSIITGALFTAFSAPNSSPPTNGLNATVWGSEYTGSGSLLNLSLFNTNSIAPSPTSSSKSSSTTFSTSSSPTSSATSSPSTPSPLSSLVYYNVKANSYTGCNNKTTFSPTDNVVLMNPLQFGTVGAANSTCGEWILIQNRENMAQSTYAKVIGECPTCDYGSLQLSLGGLSGLAPDLPWDELQFGDDSSLTIQDLMDPESVTTMDVESTLVSPNDLVNIVWTLTDAPNNITTSPDTPAPLVGKPTGTTTITPTATTTTTSATSSATLTTTPPPQPTTTPSPQPTTPPSAQFSGRATWYSDTNGQCEHSYSQSDLIVAVNQAQMGTSKNLCGKKILLTQKGSDVQVEVTIVDMCPGQYCKFGDLDLSQAAFKKFAGLGVGELQLQWSFI